MISGVSEGYPFLAPLVAPFLLFGEKRSQKEICATKGLFSELFGHKMLANYVNINNQQANNFEGLIFVAVPFQCINLCFYVWC